MNASMTSELWPIAAMARIQATASLREALQVSAVYLREIWNELISVRKCEDLIGNYDALVEEELQREGLKMSPDGDKRCMMWAMGSILLGLAERGIDASDDDLRSEVLSFFAQDGHGDELSNESAEILLREDFCVILFAHHQWLMEERG